MKKEKKRKMLHKNVFLYDSEMNRILNSAVIKLLCNRMFFLNESNENQLNFIYVAPDQLNSHLKMLYDKEKHNNKLYIVVVLYIVYNVFYTI